LRIHLFDRAGAIYSRPYNIHDHPHVLIRLLCLAMVAPSEALGYDPTILITTIRVGPRTLIVLNKIISSDLIRGRATSCWRVRDNEGDQYVVKDCWTNVTRITREVDILKATAGVRGVPKLIDTWKVEINGEPDVTSSRRPPFLVQNYPDTVIDTQNVATKVIAEIRQHHRLLMKPVGTPLPNVSSLLELVSCMLDVLDGKWLYSVRWTRLTVAASARETCAPRDFASRH
ncbi:hypothetical protein BV22DRAFT_1027165, partial [Leucogyrophana mollusca]